MGHFLERLSSATFGLFKHALGLALEKLARSMGLRLARTVSGSPLARPRHGRPYHLVPYPGCV